MWPSPSDEMSSVLIPSSEFAEIKPGFRQAGGGVDGPGKIMIRKGRGTGRRLVCRNLG